MLAIDVKEVLIYSQVGSGVDSAVDESGAISSPSERSVSFLSVISRINLVACVFTRNTHAI